MSKNSNEKQLNSRLSNIFSDLDKPKEFPGLKSTSDLTGWIWEVDTRGIVLGCSPEIELYLGIPASDLIGRPLSDYSSLQIENADLPTDPNRAMLPTAIQINFAGRAGATVATESYVLAKLDDDGDIISWRGITSVVEPEQPAKEAAEEEPIEDEFKALATLDITPEIPQPDMSLSDIWKGSSMDTAPLSLEDALRESQAFEESLDPDTIGKIRKGRTEELKTFQVLRGADDQEESAASPEEPSDEEPGLLEVEELQPEEVQASYGEPEDQADLEPEEEWGTPVETPDSMVEPVSEEDREETAAVEEIETAAPQDEIDTIRYAKQTYQKEIEEFEAQQAQMEEETEPSQKAEEKPIVEFGFPKISEDASLGEKETGDLLAVREPEKSGQIPDQQDEDQEFSSRVEPPVKTPMSEPEAADLGSDWIPEFKPAEESEALETEPEQPARERSRDDLSTKPLKPEEVAKNAQRHADFSFQDVHEPQAMQESITDDELIEIGGEQDQAGAVQEIDTAELDEEAIEADLDEPVEIPEEYDSAIALQPDFQAVEDMVQDIESTIETGDLTAEPDTPSSLSSEEALDDLEEKISSLDALGDIDLQPEETEPDMDTGRFRPDAPMDRSGRRPTIDTASLIPSLLRGAPDAKKDAPTDQSVEEFLKEVEEDTVRIETKELQSYTTDEGVELTISRGVQELLKIVDDNPNRVWKDDELRLVEQVHTQLELALENANLFQQTQLALAETDERARQLRLLNQMGEQINQTDDLMEIFQIVASKARDIFRIDQATVAVVSEDRRMLEIAASAGNDRGIPKGSTFPIEGTPSQVVIRENRVYIMPNTDATAEIKSGMLGPITTANTVIGVVNLTSQYANIFNDRDANLLTQLLATTNASVENRRLFEQIESALSATEEQARRLAELNRLSEQFSSATSIDEVFTLIDTNLNKIIPADFWGYTIIDEESQTYKMRMATEENFRGSDGTQMPPPQSTAQPLENSIIGKAVRDRRTVTEFNCKDTLFYDVRQWSDDYGIRTAMATPILAGNKVIGVVGIGSKQLSAFTIQEENILLSVASLSGSTIDNRQLLTQIQKRSQQLETSAEVSRVASTILDPAELLPEVVELIKDGFNLYYAGIFLVDESGELSGEPGKWAVLRAGSGEPGKQMMAAGHKLELGGESMIGTAVASSQARIALNVGEEASFFRNPYLPNTRSEMALPLTSRGQVLGALSIQSEVEDAFSQEDLTALQTMADQLANAIENARLFEQTELRAEELTVLNEMARGFSQSMVMEELIENTYEFTGRLMDAANFSLALYYPEDEFYEYRLFVESGQKVQPPQRRVRLGDGVSDWIIRNKLPVLIPGDVETYLQALGVTPSERLPKSWLGVPMLLGNQVTGVISVQNYLKENVYTNHSLDLLIAVSNQAAVAIDNARRFQATQTRARHEEILRRVTTQVHSTSDPDAILRTAVREVSDALGKPAFVKLGQVLSQEDHTPENALPTPDIELEPSQLPSATPPDFSESEEV